MTLLSLRLLTSFLFLQFLLVLAGRWIDPDGSAFIRRDRRELRRAGSAESVRFEWADLEDISAYLQLAVIAAEDQKFPDHFGFDIPSIRDAVGDGGGSMRGASTITQQVAKNLYLWPGRSWVRKGLEATFTLWIELLWPKERILEVYLNVAQFDDHIFGAEAAAVDIFGRSAADLGYHQSALLAAVLPNPVAFSAARPSEYLNRRVLWIREQMRQLGAERLDFSRKRPKA